MTGQGALHAQPRGGYVSGGGAPVTGPYYYRYNGRLYYYYRQSR